MSRQRRHFLLAALAGGLAWGSGASTLLPASPGRRVVVVGGGWGGLSAARALRQAAPELEVVLLEPHTVFWSNPLSNKWLVGLRDERLLVHDIAAAARAFGYTHLPVAVSAIDREQRQVITASGSLGYDWLILATGIGHDYGAWFGGDREAAVYTRQHFPAAFTGRDEAVALKAKLERFVGGDLVMTIPPMPYRCPPAPYERAALIAGLLKGRGSKGRLHILDPNPMVLGFERVFRNDYRDQINYIPQARVKSVDPFKQVISTDFDTIAFSDAILMPPQQASPLAWQADLIARDAQGRPTGWAAADPIHLHAPGDDRVFLVGDLLDKVSPLFGHYPKTGQLAARLGRIAAAEIAARAQDREPPQLLPDSVCYVLAKAEPEEMLRVEAHYNLRGDGLIRQVLKQTYDAQPRGEDVLWARALFAEFLAPATGADAAPAD